MKNSGSAYSRLPVNNIMEKWAFLYMPLQAFLIRVEARFSHLEPAFKHTRFTIWIKVDGSYMKIT